MDTDSLAENVQEIPCTDSSAGAVGPHHDWRLTRRRAHQLHASSLTGRRSPLPEYPLELPARKARRSVLRGILLRPGLQVRLTDCIRHH